MYNISHPILNKNTIFKIYNTNEENFIYAILAALYSNKIDRRAFHQTHAYNNYKKSLNLKNIVFPMSNKHISIFLKNNNHLDISIRLFESIKISKNDMQIYNTKIIGTGSKIINILFHKIYKNKKSYYIYFWIKNINSIKKEFRRKHVCTICYDRFSTINVLKRHLLICNSTTKEQFPPPNTFLSYDNKKAAKYASPISIIGFADFESKLKKLDDSTSECKNGIINNKSTTVKTDLHTIVSYSLIFVDILGDLIYEKNFCGENAAPHFFNSLDDIEEKLLLRICKNKTPINVRSLSAEELQKFNSATHCDVCYIKFDKNDRLKCKNLDHCHYSNKYRSASCTMCTPLKRSQNHIPIYFHNFCAYDSKLLLNGTNKNT